MRKIEVYLDEKTEWLLRSLVEEVHGLAVECGSLMRELHAAGGAGAGRPRPKGTSKKRGRQPLRRICFEATRHALSGGLFLRGVWLEWGSPRYVSLVLSGDGRLTMGRPGTEASTALVMAAMGSYTGRVATRGESSLAIDFVHGNGPQFYRKAGVTCDLRDGQRFWDLLEVGPDRLVFQRPPAEEERMKPVADVVLCVPEREEPV